MKNNLLINNSNKSKFGIISKHRNLIILGIIIFFLIIIGIIIYKNIEDEENIITTDLLNIKSITDSPIYSNSNNNKNNITESVHLSYQNVNLLNNIKDRTIKDEIESKKQVYNIGNNIFTYDDAKAACKAHNGELATYHQVVDTYKKGGEWCNYGWSDDQMALYPTQKKHGKNFKKTPKAAECVVTGV